MGTLVVEEKEEEEVDAERPVHPHCSPTLYGISVSTLLVCFLILSSTAPLS